MKKEISLSNSPLLTPGSRVHLIVPGTVRSFEHVQAGVQILRDWGLQVHVPDYVQTHDSLYVADDQTRARYLMEAFADKEAKLFWAASGGYGTTKLMPLLPASYSICAPCMGFSDITALNTFITQQWGGCAIHGPNVATLARLSKEELAHVHAFLFENAPSAFHATPMNTLAMQTPLEGPFCGGNLSVITYSIGTPWQIQTRYKVLVLEDVDERAYKVDLHLAHLAQAGAFDDVRAVFFGTFSFNGEADAGEGARIQQVLQEFAAMVSFPVFQTDAIGHTPVNRSFMMESTCCDAQTITAAR